MDDPISYANLSSMHYIDALYASYLQDPFSVDVSWQRFFEGMQFAEKMPAVSGPTQAGEELRVARLIDTYRSFGHKCAKINPIAMEKEQVCSELQPENFGFSNLDEQVPTCGLLSREKAPLKDLIVTLQKIYCGSIGFEYMGLQNPELEAFIQEKVEGENFSLTKEEKEATFYHLNRSEMFESFIQMKFPGQKRFSLEGGETLIPMLFEIFEVGGACGVQNALMGMAHRGRLNVLTNVCGKPYSAIFHEFSPEHFPTPDEGSGDVKYHKGYKTTFKIKNGSQFSLELAANPSHLEAVDPVVLGATRAIQDKREVKNSVLPILIHGDAAVAGQGIIYETLQLCRLEGYATAGTLHIVINNQVGFTASTEEARSNLYCTDIAKSFGAPVFHVNGEDPEKAILVAKLAAEIRQKFGIDVFIDLSCYRKYGHNESDEPGFTQPKEYKLIRSRANVRDLYAKKLIEEGTMSEAEVQSYGERFKAELEQELSKPEEESPVPAPIDPFVAIPTATSADQLENYAKQFCVLPQDFNPHPKLKRLFEQRLEMVTGEVDEKRVDWGMGECLAYAKLLSEGISIRISGQDSRRGTFSHRHAALIDQESGKPHFPLQALVKEGAQFAVFNSPLSEYGVMGFDYGYSLEKENALTIWEAQFGDFANGAQIIIDQFITSAERKWGQFAPLVLFLPHGYEGQGPEHSSARIERFLQLASNDSLFICNVTTPAQEFHLLCRHAKLPFKRPLVLFTPKALLRFAPSLSSVREFASESFEEILDDPAQKGAAKKILLCSGKVYYDLVEKRADQEIAIVRVEQLYPLHKEKLKKIVDKYPQIEEVMWVQEEHENMGAWEFMRPHLHELFPQKKISYGGRDRSAVTACGTSALHKKELKEWLEKVFS
ncbi:MAG: 2-oxoglutarate dehydrogenase E1 component [Candidatus Algichlamydia australiensis]|nr:2-oxoglutarate dehydrogenase E1 component [Chlamydiales bacterium]